MLQYPFFHFANISYDIPCASLLYREVLKIEMYTEDTEKAQRFGRTKRLHTSFR